MGESVGIVGSTGAGKSSLLNLLLGLLYPTSGSIKIDGNTITRDNVLSWQKNIGYVAQTPFIVDSSIRENIALGLSKCDINYDKIVKSAGTANIHDFICKDLPQGYNTLIGENGAKLSGGQCQRIAIARALYNDPPVLILDEATSALDYDTESRIISSLHDLSPKITLISVVHRVHTLKQYDKIVVLNQGELVNIGNYNTLSRNCNYFKSLL